MESSHGDLRRGDTRGRINLVTQGGSGLQFGPVGVGTLALALPDLRSKPVAGVVPELQDLT